MTLRVAVAGLSHETNTYADASSGVTPYEAFTIQRGDEIVAAAEGTRTYVGGILDGIAEIGAEALPTYVAVASPSGSIAAGAYTRLRDELVAALEQAAPFDAIALELHGAGVAEDVDDVEGDLGRVLRERFGDVPIVVALDLHGNFTDAMAERYDISLGVHLYPHTDMWERGYEAVLTIPRLVDGSLRPTTYVEHLPILLPTSTTDDGFPAARMVEVFRAVEERAGVLDCTVFHGFPFTDTPDVGVHVVCTTENDPELARATAREVAAWVWDHREDFRPSTLSPEDAVARAIAHSGGPVVINETSDNPGGGTPGDGTHLLRAMLDAGLTNACFGFIRDPEVVAAAIAAGVGAVIDVELGGKTDDIHGKPVPVQGRVRAITDGTWTSRAIAPGASISHGPMVRLTVAGIDVLVSTLPSQTFEPEVFLLHGIDVTRYSVVGLKSSNHFRAGFRAVAAAILTADAPGLTTQRVEVFEHRRAVRPMWPADAEASYTAGGVA